jgi:hypothetical protein
LPKSKTFFKVNDNTVALKLTFVWQFTAKFRYDMIDNLQRQLWFVFFLITLYIILINLQKVATHNFFYLSNMYFTGTSTNLTENGYQLSHSNFSSNSNSTGKCVTILFWYTYSYNLFQNQKSTNSAFYFKNTIDNVADFCF